MGTETCACLTPQPWSTNMHEKNCSAVGTFGSHQDAEDAIKELQK
jgi:hypothetical protein